MVVLQAKLHGKMSQDGKKATSLQQAVVVVPAIQLTNVAHAPIITETVVYVPIMIEYAEATKAHALSILYKSSS